MLLYIPTIKAEAQEHSVTKPNANIKLFWGMYKSTRKKAQIVRDFVAKYYEEGRQDRCKLWVYRNKVRPLLGIGERTFFRYLDEAHDPEDDDDKQLQIDFDLCENSLKK